MWNEAKFSLRSVLRNPRRSAFALSAILFGVIALMLSGGFIEWIFWAMREATVYSRLGHIQIAKRDFFTHGQGDLFSFVLPDGMPELQQVLSTPRVRALAPRLEFNGLISHAETTIPFIGEGVDPSKEAIVSRLVHIENGEPLSVEDEHSVILGHGLAENLGVSVGDRVSVLTTTGSGSINGVEARVRGVFFTVSKQYDDAALRMPIVLAKKLLRVSGAHTWIVILDKTEDTPDVLARLRREMPPASSAVELKPWNELADFYNKTVALYSNQMNVLKLIIGLIIVLTVANTMMMTVLERTHEIGTMMALGNRRSKILRLFVIEGLGLGVIGGTLGVASGFLLAVLISRIGIPMPPAPGMSTGFSGEIRVTFGLMLSSLLIAVGTPVIAAVYPAWKASRLNIVDALRHNR
ncbi:MAG TPA: FtsX-like permease family protein [Candidatus Binatia bacterium]